ncbi:MAG: aminopeptidase [Alphaproteobacteria bacterium]|nr:aminopeptidase [Alphaproteobacteria bacterium]
MILAAVSPYFKRDLEQLEAFAAVPSLWRDDAQTCVDAYKRDMPTDDAIGIVQKARRVIAVFVCGLQDSGAFMEAYNKAPLFNWHDYQEPPAPRALQQRLADMLYIVRGRDDVPVFEIGDQARFIAVALIDRAVRERIAFDFNVDDVNFTATLYAVTSEDGIAALAKNALEKRMTTNVRIMVHQNLSERAVIDGPEDKQKLYRSLMKPYAELSRSGKIRWILTSIPTRRDAEVDGIAYDDYTELYFRMCDQPWDAIKAAQYRLIEKLNATKMLRFTNSDGTDLSMNIDGFTFCNSTIVRNIPGSEVFSAPSIDSTEGKIVAKGRFAAKGEGGQIMEDLTLRFEKGYLAEAKAAKGQEHLDRAIGIDAGARRIGEIGIGTNPYLKQHVASILLSEKIGGSFHVALGDAYTMTDYLGDPVRVDNGNRSLLHWDITTMLIGKQGQMIADGTPIMKDGLFLDPALDVLNRGWRALPFDARPAAWQAIYPER